LYGIRSDGSTETSKRAEIALREQDVVLDFRGTVTFEETDIDYVIVKYTIVGAGAAQNIYIGQTIVTEGYNPGPFRQLAELLLLSQIRYDASFDSTAFSTSTVSLDLTAAGDYSGYFQPGTHAVLGRMFLRDSGSAASATARTEIQGTQGTVYATAFVQGVPNDTYVHRHFIVNAIQDLYNTHDIRPQFDVDITASGGSTLDLNMYLSGQVTT